MSSPFAPLTIELVPASCWYSNVRSNVRPETWDRLQSQCFQRAHFRCEICTEIGPSHPVECHEIWHYDDARHVQRLDGLVALCPACHRVKHMGRALQTGGGNAAIEHFARVNAIDIQQAVTRVHEALVLCQQRSCATWALDVRILASRYGVQLDARGCEVGLAY